MSGLNWHKNFGHCFISGWVAPSSMQKLWTPLATIFVEKKFWKNFWWGFRHIWVTLWKEFLISWKKWRFEIFWSALPSRVQWSMSYSSATIPPTLNAYSVFWTIFLAHVQVLFFGSEHLIILSTLTFRGQIAQNVWFWVLLAKSMVCKYPFHKIARYVNRFA